MDKKYTDMKKYTPKRKYKDLLHVAIFVIILLVFASYESERKADIREAFAPSELNSSLRSDANFGASSFIRK